MTQMAVINMGETGVICARCGKPILQRKRFQLVYETREKYSPIWETTPLQLYFHEKCIKNISVKVRDLWDLVKVMNEIEGNRNEEKET